MKRISYIIKLSIALCLIAILNIKCRKTAAIDTIGTVFIQSGNGYIYAVRASDGKAVGMYKSPIDGLSYYPIVYNNTLYANDYYGKIYALDALAGNPKWLQPFNTNGRILYPIIYNNTLYTTSTSTNSKQLLAIDLATGQAKANFNVFRENISYANPSLPIAYRSNIYSFYGDTLYAIDAITGNPKANYNPLKIKNSTWHIAPVTYNGIIYLISYDMNANNSSLHAVEANNGNNISAYPISFPERIVAISKVYNNTIYLITWKGKVYAFDINSKTLKAGFKTFESNSLYINTDPSYPYLSPIIEDGILCVEDNANKLIYGVDANSGNKLWEFDPQGFLASTSSPIIYKGTIYIGAATALYALDLKTGAKKWEYLTKGTVESSPCLVTNDGKVIARIMNTDD